MKRALKVLVSMSLIIAIVFLGAGIFFPKVSYEIDVLVDRSIDSTFMLFNNESRISEWLPTVKKIELTSGNAREIGSQRRITNEIGNQSFELTETLTAYEQNDIVGTEFNIGGMKKQNTFLFSEEDGKTKIIHQSTVEESNFVRRCRLAFSRSIVKKIDKDNLASFKKFVENN